MIKIELMPTGKVAHSVKIIDMETGKELTDYTRVTINILPDEIVTANIEMLVGDINTTAIETIERTGDKND